MSLARLEALEHRYLGVNLEWVQRTLCDTIDAKSILFTDRLIKQSVPFTIFALYKWQVKLRVFQGYFQRKIL